MATPTAAQAVLTPQSHLSNTPGRPKASPRPGTATTAQKSLAFKSPAGKTPASAHSHARNVSVSSNPSSTPMGQNAIRDELLNLDSPAAALINSIASGQDGLGISTTPQPGLPQDGQQPRNPESERLLRLQQVVNSLRTKMVGRGITREGVERVARVHGFEALWDEDNLTIAGNMVELEINFDALVVDKVTDLVLKLNTADGESQVQQRATTVLKGDFGIDDPSPSGSAVENLSEFSHNIQYLAQMDRIDATPNAFEIVGGLYKTFRDIWEEEKKRMKWRHDKHHLCKGSIGRPCLDEQPRLGVCLDYWSDKHDVEVSVAYEEDRERQRHSLKRARLSCEAGGPSISSSLKWLSPDVLHGTHSENMLGSRELLQQPAWIDSTTSTQDTSQTIEEDLATESPKTLNAHFLCTLDPLVLVPLNTVLQMNNGQNVIDIHQANATPYVRALQSARNSGLPRHTVDTFETRWARRLPSKTGTMRSHSYALYSAAQEAELWFYPLSQVRLSHPQQLASILPVARQYAVLWALLRNVVTAPAPEPRSIMPSALSDKRRVTKRSNAKPNILRVSNGRQASSTDEDVLNVDISLDVMSDPTTCKLEIFAPLPMESALKRGRAFVHVSVLVLPNGMIDVSEVSGTSDEDTASLKAKLSKMLRVTEDIGMVVEWLVDRQRSEDQA